MRARLPTIALRLVILTAVWLLGTATVTLAQETGSQPAVDPPQTGTTGTAQEEPAGPLVIPDVRGLPYVFAKGVLEDAGFAWKVKGKVDGYAVNLVKEQSVKPGTRVVDTGAPTVVLELQANPDYEERGLPESASPYRGTELLLVSGGEPTSATAPTEPTETQPAETTETAPAETTETAPAETTETTPAETTETEPASTEPAETTPSEAEERPPAFVVVGAPPEPLDEIPLPLRAKRLGVRLAAESQLTAEVQRFWQYQHAWIVTGARFGWWRGAEALRILIGVDEDAQRRWGVGQEREQVARAALAEVLRKSK